MSAGSLLSIAAWPRLRPRKIRKSWIPKSRARGPKADHGEESYKGLGRLTDRVGLITGGDSGIGRAVSIAYAREGADVLISHLPEEERDAQDTQRWVGEAL